MCDTFDSTLGLASHFPLASPDPVTLPISNSVGVSTPPTDNTESSSTSDSSSPSSSCSITDTSSASSSDSSSSLPSSSESSSTSSSESASTSPPPSTTPSTPPRTDERSDPPMSQETSDSSGPTVTDTPPSPPSSSSSSTSTMSSSSVTPPPPPPPPPPTSSSSSGTQESTSTTDTSTTSTSTSNTSTSTSTSISTSRSGGQRTDVISTTPTTTSTSDSSTPTSPGGGSSSTSPSTSPSSADRPGDSTTGSQNPPTTANGSGNPVTSVPMQNNGSPTTTPRMTLSEPVTFTTTDASGSTHLTVPPEFTTVIVTTLPGGTFTTFTEVMANPSPILHPPDDVNRDAVAAFFQNKGAVAGVFIAASLAICAIILFVIFAIRRRRNRFRTERDAEIAAGLAAAISNSRFADDEDYPVVFRNGQRRSPLLDDDDAYNTLAGPVMYNNPNGVGPPTQHMPIISEVPYPSTAAHYTHARTNSGSPSPNRDSMGLPVTSFEQVSPTGNSGRSSYGGAAYFGRDSSSPTNSAPGSANHGTVANAPSVGHAPSSYGGHRPPASAGRDGSGNGTGSGSGRTSQPSLMTATPAQRGASSSRLEDMYPPQYEQYSRPNSGSAVMGIAYEPDPVPHEHQIVTDLRAVRDPRDEIGSPLSADIAVSVASVYSRDEWDEEIAMSREDSRLDPVMRRTGGLASTASVGPRDEEDYSRRVMHQQLMSPSTGSNSHSMSHSHSTH